MNISKGTPLIKRDEEPHRAAPSNNSSTHISNTLGHKINLAQHGIGINFYGTIGKEKPSQQLFGSTITKESSLKEHLVTDPIDSAKEKEHLFSKPSSDYGTFTNTEKSPFLPKMWDHDSIVDALKFHQLQSKTTSNPRVKNQSDCLSLLLNDILQSQEALKKAVYHKVGDAAKAYQNIFFNGIKFVDANLQKQLNNQIPKVTEFQNQSHVQKKIACCFLEVALLSQPNESEGALKLTIRENGTDHLHNLSEFSFEKEGSMQEYYQIINSKNIVSGTNIQIVEKQKSLLEEASKYLEEARRLTFLKSWT